ncbi:hypothetical protein AGABI2DRAFT_178714 [Agaricus bisporus var. bisporus H97]|uniref:hypothetical protein n=1 Tax=Agaricus bisporus var. bisporus (strain H97 / ATCC MYA-4626 / FGSC 10389) TaxID=936046 RepID=UPI00029F760E|nr:hypothetical protein AGABI2DRAFT_178714 [Agaricus bisporus var. bisporus H97]EKV46323.1 hypothetical protein AGABI2DRAFT_178714 [Agaricus bisporus var. bisporus H97]
MNPSAKRFIAHRPSVIPPTTSFSNPICYGVRFFGVVFDLLLFGILTAQAYTYYLSFPKDRALLKIAIVWVYLVGVAQTGLALVDLYISSQAMFYRFRPHYFSHPHPDHLWLSVTALTAAVAIVIQSMYAHRIYLISEKRWLTIMIICMSVGQLASGILGAICYSGTQSLSAIVLNTRVWKAGGGYVCSIGFKWIWGPLNVICDLTITICMVTFVSLTLYDSILMVIYTVLLSLWSNAGLGITPWYSLPGLMMSKVYSNSMLVLLNNRATVVNGRNAMESFEFVEVSGRGYEGNMRLRNTGQHSTASTQSQ